MLAVDQVDASYTDYSDMSATLKVVADVKYATAA
jgi:hypothetical protein